MAEVAEVARTATTLRLGLRGGRRFRIGWVGSLTLVGIGAVASDPHASNVAGELATGTILERVVWDGRRARLTTVRQTGPGDADVIVFVASCRSASLSRRPSLLRTLALQL